MLISSCFDQDDYFIAYAHAPTDSAIDQAKDLTTVALLAINATSKTLSAVGFNTLPGQGQIAVVEGSQGMFDGAISTCFTLCYTDVAGEKALSLLHLCDGRLDRYHVHLSNPSQEDAKLRSSRSHVDLKSFFTPLPTRPHSRAGQDGAETGQTRIPKEDPGNASDFGRMLGKKLLGRSGDKVDKPDVVFVLGPAVQVQPAGLLSWTSMRVKGQSGIGWTKEVCQVSLRAARVSAISGLKLGNLLHPAVLDNFGWFGFEDQSDCF